MSDHFLPHVDDALDTNIHDLDSFELSDDENDMSDAETALFSSTNSSSLELDTTVNLFVEHPDTQQGDSEAANSYYTSILSHPQVAKFFLFLHLLI